MHNGRIYITVLCMEKVREKINREMRSGIYTLLILKVIDELGETYGYEIQKYVNKRAEIELKDATIYPVLRYLVKKKVLNTYWTEPNTGVPRKYYSLTEDGKILLVDLIEDYKKLMRAANRIIGGD